VLLFFFKLNELVSLLMQESDKILDLNHNSILCVLFPSLYLTPCAIQLKKESERGELGTRDGALPYNNCKRRGIS